YGVPPPARYPWRPPLLLWSIRPRPQSLSHSETSPSDIPPSRCCSHRNGEILPGSERTCAPVLPSQTLRAARNGSPSDTARPADLPPGSHLPPSITRRSAAPLQDSN